MKAGAPWSVKGVEAETRETAKAKAKAAGMTLGQWLNRAIADADKPAAATPPAQAGGSLETARIMRAIAELARRVDQVRDAGGTAIPESARLEAAIGDLTERVDRMTQALPQGPQQLDQQRLERGLLAIVRRLDELERKAGTTPEIASLQEGLARIEQQTAGNGGSEIGALRQSIDDLGSRLAERPETDAGDSDVKTLLERQSEDIRKLMNGLVNIAGKVDALETRISDGATDPPRDAGAPNEAAAMAAMLAPITEAIGRLEARLPEKDAEEPDASGSDGALLIRDGEEPLPSESDAPVAVAPPSEPEPEPEPEPVDAPEPEPQAESEPEPEETIADGLEDEPEPVAEAPALSALHDLTARQDVRTGPVYEDEDADPLFHDLPPFDDPGPSEEPEQEPDPEPEPEAEPQSPEEPAAPAAGTGEDDEYPPADGGPAMATEVPADATPDRPRRLVPVESLLDEDGPRRRDDDDLLEEGGFGAFADDGRRAEPPRSDGGGDFRLDRPIDMDHRQPPAPAPYPRRRRGMGYLVAALIFIAILLGGYWFVATPMFDDVTERVTALWDEGREAVGGFELPGNEENAETVETPAEDGASTDAATPPPAEPAPAADKTATAPAAAPDNDPPLEMETTGTELAAVEPGEETAPAAEAAAPPPAPASADDDADPVLTAARNGDPDAQYEMGVRYRDGIGVDVSYGEAADWFDRAAQQGHVDAQANLGVMYRQGVGVPRDIDLAKLWLHAAARSGHADAQKYLGEVYAQDDLGTPDYFQAARWFREAAEQGVVDAQYNMGVLYEGGLGVPRDFEQAYYWFSLASRSGDQSADADIQRVVPLLSQEQRSAIDERVAAFEPVEGGIADAPADAGETLTRRDQIRELQQLLVARGYDPGEPDGLIGARTREAIRDWQKDRGLPENGQVTMRVLEGLRSGG